MVRNGYDWRVELLQERITELELELDRIGWQEVAPSIDRWNFSRDALRKIMRLARLYFLKNPLVNRAVVIQAVYVFGQGIEITARDRVVQEIVEQFMEDNANQAELTSHQARVMKECDLQVDGNIFFAFFRDPRFGTVRVRTIPVDEIEAIIHNPDDRKEPWFYKRCYYINDISAQTGLTSSKLVTTYYPDWNAPADVLRQYRSVLLQQSGATGDVEIAWDVPVFHMKVGGLSEMQFGVPEIYQALDWARAYREFLEDWSSLVKALSRFAFKLTGPSDPRAIQAAKQLLESTLGLEGDEANPPPPAGSIFASSPEFNLQPMRSNGAVVRSEDGRHLKLMVCAALGLPETFFGDVSVGTLATAESLDRPTELKFRDRQTLWQDALYDILQFVVRSYAQAGYRGLQVRRDRYGRDVIVRRGRAVDTYIDIAFPPILERDVTKVVDAIVTAATLAGKPFAEIIDRKTTSRLLYQALRAGDVDGLLKMLYPEDNSGIV